MGARLADLGGATSAADLEFLLKKVYSHERYLLMAHPATGRVLVLLREGAGPRDELKAFFQVGEGWGGGGCWYMDRRAD